MCRSPREFRTEAFELEGRLLLTIGPALTHVSPYGHFAALPGRNNLTSTGPIQMVPVPNAGGPVAIVPAFSRSLAPLVQFEGTTGSLVGSPTQVVTQQAGEATVTLVRSNTAGSLQVQVTTVVNGVSVNAKVGALNQAVGVNVGAVDQTVTFADGQGRATLTVPILSGAPNPGVVDVALAVRPVGPSTNVTYPFMWPLDLKIVASEPTLAPKVVSEFATDQGIVLSFNKPMNPVGVSNVNNYAVSLVNFNHHNNIGGGLGLFVGGTRTSVSVNSVRLQSAQYDPATQSVTLITKRKLNLSSETTLTQVPAAKTSVRPGHHSKVAQGLIDLQGNPINVDTTPGKVEIRLKNPNFTSTGW